MKKLACAVLFVLAYETPAFAADRDVDRAAADEPAPRQIEVSPLLGFSDGFGAGAGLRAGYMFKNGVYAGGAFTYHSGGLTLSPGDDRNVGIAYPSAEIGYDFRHDSMSFRTYVGAGAGFMFSAAKTGDATPLFYPGASIMYRPEQSLFFGGVDARYVFVNEPGASQAAVFLVLGIQL